jgi:hypothetical protein
MSPKSAKRFWDNDMRPKKDHVTENGAISDWIKNATGL